MSMKAFLISFRITTTKTLASHKISKRKRIELYGEFLLKVFHQQYLLRRICMKFIAVLALLFSLSAWSQSSQEQQDGEALGALIRSAKLLVDADLRCTSSADCTTIEIGSRACGGPSTHFITSEDNSNMEEILYLAKQTRIKGETFNRNYGRISICTVVTPPVVECIKNQCK